MGQDISAKKSQEINRIMLETDVDSLFQQSEFFQDYYLIKPKGNNIQYKIFHNNPNTHNRKALLLFLMHRIVKST